MEPIYIYKEKKYLQNVIRVLVFALTIMWFFTPYFYIGIIFAVFVYFGVKNTFNGFTIYSDYIEVKNLVSTKRIKQVEFKKASILQQQRTASVIVLKTKSKSKIVFSPRHKFEAIEVIKALETFGIEFVKSKRYAELKEWSKTKSGEDSYWH